MPIFESISVWLEDHDVWSTNERVSGSLSPDEWNNRQCAPYEIRYAINFEEESINSVCWQVGTDFGTNVVGIGVESCEIWMDPAESYIWTINV